MSNFPIPLDAPFEPWDGLIFEEDRALQIALTTIMNGGPIQVIENNGQTRNVNFYWETPQREMNPQVRTTTQGNTRSVPELVPPYISLAFIRMDRDPTREQRNFRQYTVYERNSGNPINNENGYAMEVLPIPMYLYYQVSAVSPNAQHVRQITNVLSQTVLLPRFGVLMCPSGTVRRLTIISGPRETPNLDRDGHRWFRHIWEIRISSELELGAMGTTQVIEALPTIQDTASGTEETFTITGS